MKNSERRILTEAVVREDIPPLMRTLRKRLEDIPSET